MTASRIMEECSHGSLRLGVRPTHFSIHHEEPELPSLPAEVYVSEPLGEVQIIDFSLGRKIIKVATDPDFRVDMGEQVWLSFNFEKTHIFDAQTGVTIA